MGALGIFALIVPLTILLSILGAANWLAMWPGKVAHRRGHPQAEAINVAGWLGLLADFDLVEWPLLGKQTLLSFRYERQEI
jgi:hypothetical protein